MSNACTNLCASPPATKASLKPIQTGNACKAYKVNKVRPVHRAYKGYKEYKEYKENKAPPVNKALASMLDSGIKIEITAKACL